jgi:polysaccharide pyruvyl transferase WcaK-like protein
MKLFKTIAYYHVGTGNRGDMAIKKAITEGILKNISVPFAFFNTKFEELTEARIENQLNTECSMLMIAGSGLYTNYPMSSGWYFPCKTELFSKIKVPIALIGIGCNNTIKNDLYKGDLKPETQASIKLINDLSCVSTVRDIRTYKTLEGIGVKKHKLMLDPGNFLDVPTVPKEKRVAINIGQHIPILGRFDGTMETRNRNIEYFSKIGNYLVNKGYKIVFIAHDALEFSLIADLAQRIPDMEYVNTDDVNVMLHEYSRCSFSIGVKMHSNILSFAAGTPFISLYYDFKSIEYLKLINWSDFGTSVFEDYYKWLEQKINLLIANNKFYTRQFKKLKQIEQIEFDKMIEQICDILERQCDGNL